MGQIRLSRRAFTVGTGAALLTSAGFGGAAQPLRARGPLQEVASAARALGVRAIVVVKDGETILSAGEVALPLRIASIRKSLLSALFGMSERSRTRLDATLGVLGVDDYQPLTPLESSATVRNLLMARSGIYLPAGSESPAMRAARPARGSHAPGSFWYYNNWDFNALGEIYQRLTAEPLSTAFEHRLAKPLGWQDFDPLRQMEWDYDAATPRFPAYKLKMSARDMARFGQLYLSRGALNGTQLIPASWVEESTRPYSTTGNSGTQRGYGYMWWVATDERGQRTAGIPTDAYTATGNGGRYISVVPSLALVVAIQPYEATGEPQAGIYTQQGAYDRLLGQIIRAAT